MHASKFSLLFVQSISSAKVWTWRAKGLWWEKPSVWNVIVSCAWSSLFINHLQVCHDASRRPDIFTELRGDILNGSTHLLFSILFHFHSIQIEQKWNRNGTGIEQKFNGNWGRTMNAHFRVPGPYMRLYTSLEPLTELPLSVLNFHWISVPFLFNSRSISIQFLFHFRSIWI